MKNICLLGGSGTMGYETFKTLWERRNNYRLSLLLRPSKKNRVLFAPYIRRDRGKNRLRITWGDASEYEHVRTAVRGSDYVLDAMACISPKADYYPELARRANIDGIANVVRAIGEEPGGNDRIKLVYTGTVAETGDRLPPLHWGRTGDPLKPSIFDYYAVTKIAGERIVLESEIRHWVSLRMTYIMPDTFSAYRELSDPIMFHLPLNSCMENISSRDAGLGMANTVEIDDDSDFWRRIYNMGGGPGMRLTAFDYLNKTISVAGGSGYRAVTDRDWFATGNFHMQYYLDSAELNRYLDYQHDSFDNWFDRLLSTLPAGLKILKKLSFINRSLCRAIDEKSRNIFKKMVFEHRNGTGFWRKNKLYKRIDSFFGGNEEHNPAMNWNSGLPTQDYIDSEPVVLDHGYDESKELLEAADLQQAAAFRGGLCDTDDWDGSMFSPVRWTCAFGHCFTAKPNTILKGGHWCPECEAPDWDYKTIASHNPFFNQVIAPFAHRLPDYKITAEDMHDIKGADRD